MSWKASKRNLHVGPKVKLASGQPFPDSIDVALENEGNEGRYKSSKEEPYTMSEFLSSLPVASQIVENKYLDKFDEELTDFDQGDDDLERLWCPDFGDSGASSSWDQSVASFMSWADEVESETTEKMRIMFNEIDSTLYEEGPSSIQNSELLNECLFWKSRFPHLRLTGNGPKNMQELPETFVVLEDSMNGDDETCEIIAIHGFPEQLEDQSLRNIDTDFIVDENIDNEISSSPNLYDKIKKAAMEQLTFYALSEAWKTYQSPNSSAPGSSHKENLKSPSSASSSSTLKADCSLSDLPERLDGVLQVSQKSICQSPRRQSSNLLITSARNNSLRQHREPRRTVTNMTSFVETKTSIVPELPLPVLKKSLNCELFGEKINPLDSRGYHSAADRRKLCPWDRRLSCASTDNDKMLTPLKEKDAVWGSPVRLQSSIGKKQISAPNTPAKLSRHLTLPPIRSMDSCNKMTSPLWKDPTLFRIYETDMKINCLKKKVELSPLPNTLTTQGRGMMQLQLARELLQKTDRVPWNECNNIGFANSKNLKKKRRSKVQNEDNL